MTAQEGSSRVHNAAKLLIPTRPAQDTAWILRDQFQRFGIEAANLSVTHYPGSLFPRAIRLSVAILFIRSKKMGRQSLSTNQFNAPA